MHTPIFHAHHTVHHSFRTSDLSASVASGSPYKFRDADHRASYCVICRLMDATITGCTLLLFLSSGWQILDSIKTAWSESCCKCENMSKLIPESFTHHRYPPRSAVPATRPCHIFREPLSVFQCGLRLLGMAPTGCPTLNLLGLEAWLPPP